MRKKVDEDAQPKRCVYQEQATQSRTPDESLFRQGPMTFPGRYRPEPVLFSARTISVLIYLFLGPHELRKHRNDEGGERVHRVV